MGLNRFPKFFFFLLHRTIQPLFIGGLLGYFTPDKLNNTNLTHAYMYAFGLVLNMIVTLVLYHAIQIEILQFGMKMRIACCSVIYKKVNLCENKHTDRLIQIK